MAKKITYLLGAGASAKALPTIRNMSLRMKYFFELAKLVLERMPRQNLLDKNRIKIYEKLLVEIEELGTPDIVAKTLVFKGQKAKNELQLLKHLLSCYMLFEQLAEPEEHHKFFEKEIAKETWSKMTAEMDESESKFPSVTIDNRYVEFLSTCLKKNESDELKFPDSLKILSWNYDHQIERALGYISSKPLVQLQHEFGIFPLTDNDDHHRSRDNKITEEILIKEAIKSSVFKLNGTAGFIPKSNKSLFDINSQTLDDRAWKTIVNIMFNEFEPVVEENKLAFAWDEDIPRISACRRACLPSLKGAEVVVVIGYSFPDFNRRIDKDLFSNFMGKLIIQSPSAEKMKWKIKGVNPNISQIETITNVDSFFIPYEFWEN